MSSMITFKITYAADNRLPYKEISVPASADYEEMMEIAAEIFNVKVSTSSIVSVTGRYIGNYS